MDTDTDVASSLVWFRILHAPRVSAENAQQSSSFALESDSGL